MTENNQVSRFEDEQYEEKAQAVPVKKRPRIVDGIIRYRGIIVPVTVSVLTATAGFFFGHKIGYSKGYAHGANDAYVPPMDTDLNVGDSIDIEVGD